jgi:hypothetical protein
MTAASKTTIKSYFETGDKPTQAQFGDFVDSCAFLAEGSAQTFQGVVNFASAVTVSGQLTGHVGTLHGFTLVAPAVSAPTITGGGSWSGSPSLSGTPTAPTAAKNTISSQIATTGFVLNQAASAATMEAAVAITEYVSPGMQHRHPGHPKAWLQATVAASAITVDASYNCSATYLNLGQYRVDFGTPFATSAYAWAGNATNTGGGLLVNQDGSNDPLPSSCRFVVQLPSTGLAADPERFSIVFFGDQ